MIAKRPLPPTAAQWAPPSPVERVQFETRRFSSGEAVAKQLTCPLKPWRRGMRSLFVLAMLTTPAIAVQPDEILKDSALETRAREISTGLRCLVCQNQSIDDSDATVAKDLRVLIREQLSSGKSDEQVIDFVVERYGEYVLLKPRFRTGTLIAWLAPFAILLAALFFAFRRKPSQSVEALTDAEKAELERLVGKQP
jgi:cytochrome c-type biogenesis protein CcmH